VHGLDTTRRFFRVFEGDVYAQGLVLAIRALSVTDRDLLNIAVLTKEFGLSQRLEQLVFSNSWSQACDIDQVLLNDTHTDEILTVLLFSFALH
jgi:hypothetical protein